MNDFQDRRRDRCRGHRERRRERDNSEITADIDAETAKTSKTAAGLLLGPRCLKEINHEERYLLGSDRIEVHQWRKF